VTALDALRAGGKAALARVLARIEARPDDPETVALLDAAWAQPVGHAIGLTGPPGVGKSTLTDALIRAFRRRDQRVAVIAVDPSSRRSRGALLGDRTRLSTDPDDAGVFVRSLAARDSLGGLAEMVWPTLTLMRALFDVVILETVGVGQSETEIADVADTVVFCAQPGAGDALQFMKAGIVEIPDIVVVTKADMGAPAARAVADLKGALSLAGSGDPVPVLSCSSVSGEGVDALADALQARVAEAKLAPTRAAQAEAWARRTLTRLFGTEGFALIRSQLGVQRLAIAPFTVVNDAKLGAKSALIVGFSPQCAD
jgi:LAO/AO transport system kinase